MADGVNRNPLPHDQWEEDRVWLRGDLDPGFGRVSHRRTGAIQATTANERQEKRIRQQCWLNAGCGRVKLSRPNAIDVAATKVIQESIRGCDGPQADLAAFGVKEALVGGIQGHAGEQRIVLVNAYGSVRQHTAAQLIAIGEIRRRIGIRSPGGRVKA